MLQTVRVKRAHGFIVFGRHHDTHHAVVLQHLHRLSLGGVEELAEAAGLTENKLDELLSGSD